MVKKLVSIPELGAKAVFDEDLFNPVKKMGGGTYRSTIESIYNAEVEIGNFSSIGLGLFVHGTTEHPNVKNREYVSNYPFGDKMKVDYPKAYSKGKIIIGSDVWIGSNVTLLSGIHIGDGAIVGANAVVAKNVSPYAIVVGNPAHIIRFRFNKPTCEALERIKWWEWDEKTIEKRIEDFKDITKFIKKYA